MSKQVITVRAPGRVCLFGEHLDYLGLYVISAAIDLHITITGSPREEKVIHVLMPDLSEEEWIDLSQPIEYRKRRDYLRSSVNVLKRRGIDFRQGCECTLTGRIPIQAGVSSSSALVIAWIGFLLALAERPEVKDKDFIAQCGYEAEVKEFNEPGGMMDHYTSSLGGVLWIDCKRPFSSMPIPQSRLRGFVLGDSEEKKKTTEILASTREDVQEGLRLLMGRFPTFDLRETPMSEVERYLNHLPERLERKLRATLVDRDLALEAKKNLELGAEDFDRKFGSLLNRHHEQLREGLGISTQKIERMIDAAMKAGAFGCKINGSGGGGCMFAYAPGKEGEVSTAIEKVGGRAYIVKVGSGVQCIH